MIAALPRPARGSGASRLRAFALLSAAAMVAAAAWAAAASRERPTTVIVVRHAEKAEAPGETDPPLAPAGRRRAEALRDALASVDLAAVYTTDTLRTRDTVAPAAASHALEPRIVDAKDVEGLAARIRSGHAGDAVLVAGHSNTIPGLLRALGVKSDVVLDEGRDYDDLFVVTLGGPGEASLLHLHYGEPSPL